VGALGVLGYLGLLAAWGVWRFGEGSLSRSAALAQFAMAVIGVLFSVYLTFLEPFVIGATCAWCLASALLMSGLMWLSVDPAVTAWRDGKLPQAASA
jgi:uncharacterized membrane protein